MTVESPSPILRPAKHEDLDVLLSLVTQYHDYEGINVTHSVRRTGIESLLDNAERGRIWLINSRDSVVGYIALCFGHSIELGGRDAFLDEFFIMEKYRDQGIGHTVLEFLVEEAKNLGIVAIHLEVSRTNSKAKKLYNGFGFVSRNKYHLMTLTL